MLTSRMQGWFLFFQGITIPLPQLGGSVVGALRKLEKDFVRLSSSENRVVRQDKLAQLGLVESRVWSSFRLCKSRWFRIRIRIEQWRRRSGVAGPKTEAAHFLRVGLTRDLVWQMGDSAALP